MIYEISYILTKEDSMDEEQKQNALVQCRGAGCKGLDPKPRSEFYPSAQTKNGLMPYCKTCHRVSVDKYQQSPKGRLTKRRRDVLLKQAIAALRSGVLGQIYPCEFVDDNCNGEVAAYFPDRARPEEFFWFCAYHRELIGCLKVAPSYEKLALLVERWK